MGFSLMFTCLLVAINFQHWSLGDCEMHIEMMLCTDEYELKTTKETGQNFSVLCIELANPCPFQLKTESS